MSVLERLRTMDGAELRFRLASETRKIADRARVSIAPPAWQRVELARLLSRNAAGATEDLREAANALRRSDWCMAQRHLAQHFTQRSARFPVAPLQISALADRVRSRFPNAPDDARDRADRMLAGHYSVLGYDDVRFGTPPDWYADPIHDRVASRDFWSDIDYLDPRYGDHKVTWEINRHQHWLALARAFHLTDDRRYYSAVVDQLENWMAVNPPLRGVNWASMLEVGFRSVSWIWMLHFFAADAAHDRADRSPWIVDLLVGLNRQLEHVARNLSRYFSPNTHLSGEALALYIGGQVLPEFEASGRWSNIGRQVLLEEAERQILADGGHVERSAHYHRYTTDFYLLASLVARRTHDAAAPAFEHAARRVSNYLRDLTDDTGRLPLLGDDDGGQLFPICYRAPWDCRDTLAAAALILDDPDLAVSEPPEEVFWFCGDTLPGPSHHPSTRSSIALGESGYYVSRTRDGDHLIFDVGRHGYLNGGHAHADALSIVLTVRNQPLLVDAGTATYTMDPALRNQFRSTAMHNTVVVDGRSQSKPRGAFHWQTRTDACARMCRLEPTFDYFEGRHAGYERIVHSRSVAAIHGLGWVIIDHLLGSSEATTDALWHIHPMWQTQARDRHLKLLSNGITTSIGCSEPIELVETGLVDLTLHSPVYGRIERGHCLRLHTKGLLPRTWMSFVSAASPSSDSGDGVAIESMAVTDKPAGWHGAAFRLWCDGREFVVLSAVPEKADGEWAESPSRLWGCGEARTDGRFVVAKTTGGDTPVRVGGTRVLLASSVHQRRAEVHHRH